MFQSSWPFRFLFSTPFQLVSKAPKRQTTIFIILGTRDAPVPTPNYTWPKHLVVKDNFWNRVQNTRVEADIPYESRNSSSSFGSVSPFQVLFDSMTKRDDHGLGYAELMRAERGGTILHHQV